MAQPILVSQGTTKSRLSYFESLVKEIFTENKNYKDHMDFKTLEVVDGKKSISIEQVRDLIREINIRPRISDKKVVLINEAQNLSVEAQNALLKILEEPPAYSHIIITVDHTDNLLDTVVSRCIVKDLNMSARVDINSEDYQSIKKEFLGLLSLNIGSKIDWVTDTKSKLKERELVLNLLDNWEAVLREKMLESISENTESNVWAERIKLTQKVKRYIRSNANVSLAIETLLLNL